MTTITCAWCGEHPYDDEIYCPWCGHEPWPPRSDCRCRTCTTAIRAWRRKYNATRPSRITASIWPRKKRS